MAEDRTDAERGRKLVLYVEFWALVALIVAATAAVIGRTIF